MTDSDDTKTGTDTPKPKTDDLTVETPATPARSFRWSEAVTAFGAAVGKTVDEVTAALELLVDANDEGVSTLADHDCVTDDDFQNAFPDVKKGNLKRAVKNLRGDGATVPTSTQVTTARSMPDTRSMGAINVSLPEPPSDEVFLKNLLVGGVPKVDATSVNAAVRAYIAADLGLYTLPELLKTKMEEQADRAEEPVGPEFFELQQLLTRRKYGDVLRAFGLDANAVSEANKKKLFTRLEGLWGSLSSFQRTLVSWQEEWRQTMADPSLIMAALTGGAAMLPPIEPADTAPVEDAATDVINKINRAFAGMGVPVACALAHDAVRIKGLLENPQLPRSVGAMNREEMLRDLGVAVSPKDVRFETDITKYVLSVYQMSVQSSEALPYYLNALSHLGRRIDFDSLSRSGTRTQRNNAAYAREYGADRN